MKMGHFLQAAAAIVKPKPRENTLRQQLLEYTDWLRREGGGVVKINGPTDVEMLVDAYLDSLAPAVGATTDDQQSEADAEDLRVSNEAMISGGPTIPFEDIIAADSGDGELTQTVDGPADSIDDIADRNEAIDTPSSPADLPSDVFSPPADLPSDDFTPAEASSDSSSYDSSSSDSSSCDSSSSDSSSSE